jgi:hypothetical protein
MTSSIVNSAGSAAVVSAARPFRVALVVSEDERVSIVGLARDGHGSLLSPNDRIFVRPATLVTASDLRQAKKRVGEARAARYARGGRRRPILLAVSACIEADNAAACRRMENGTDAAGKGLPYTGTARGLANLAFDIDHLDLADGLVVRSPVGWTAAAYTAIAEELSKRGYHLLVMVADPKKPYVLQRRAS